LASSTLVRSASGRRMLREPGDFYEADSAADRSGTEIFEAHHLDVATRQQEHQEEEEETTVTVRHQAFATSSSSAAAYRYQQK